MRKFILFTLFFPACFSLFGQTTDQKSNDIVVYVLPVAGYGKEKDNDYFLKQVAYEVIFQRHRVADSRDSGNYVFRGTIEPVSGVPVKELAKDPDKKDDYSLISERAVPPVKNIPGRQEYFSIDKVEEIYFLDSTGEINKSTEIKPQAAEEGYYFILELLDGVTGEVLGRKKLLYLVTDASVSKLVSVIVYDLLSKIPDGPPKQGDSRDRWLYFETSLLWMPRIYYGGYDKINLLSIGMKLGMELRFISFMSLGAGAQITQENISVPAGETNVLMMEAPVSLKAVFKIDKDYALEPYGGASYNQSIGTKLTPSKYSWFAGVQFGIKDRSETGMFVIDPRFSMDFYDSVIPAQNLKYRRYCVQLGLGYKFGAIQKRK